jgi:hypothetical protein
MITSPKLGERFANRGDNAGNFSARRERSFRLELVSVLNNEGIGVVHVAGFHLNKNFSEARLRIRQLLNCQFFRATSDLALNSFHPALSFPNG